MPRFQNNDGNVLVVADLGRTVGPFEEFDFPGYDPETHGPVAGCTWLDAPPPETEDAGGGEDPKPSAKRGSKAAEKNQESGE